MVYYKRRTYKKRPYKRFTRKYKKFNKISRPIGSGELGKRFFKLRQVVEITTNEAHGGTDVAYAGSFDNNPYNYQDFSNIAALFDMYKACAIKIKFIPQATAESNYSPGYLYVDYNSKSLAPTVIDALQHESLKVVNLQRPFTFYRKFPKMIPMASVADVIDPKGYIPTSDPMATSVVGFCTGGFVSEAPSYQFTLGTAIITLYLVAKARN